MVETIFSTPLGQTTLVFTFVFTLVFAVLQKSNIFGQGKKQSDALIALATALLTITVGSAMDFITSLVPFMAVALVVVLVFLLLAGFFFKAGDFDTPPWMKNAAFGLAFLAVIIAVSYFTGVWDWLYFAVFDGGDSLVGNAILVIVAIGAIMLAWFGKSGEGGSGKSS